MHVLAKGVASPYSSPVRMQGRANGTSNTLILILEHSSVARIEQYIDLRSCYGLNLLTITFVGTPL